MIEGTDYDVGDDVVVCVSGSIYDGLAGTVVDYGKWWDGGSGAIRVEPSMGGRPSVAVRSAAYRPMCII